MIKSLRFVIGALVWALSQPSTASDPTCSSGQFSKLVSQSNVSFQLGRYVRAQQHGEKALSCGRALGSYNNPRFIKLLNQLNQVYKKLDQLSEVKGRVKEAYALSRDRFGKNHKITMQSLDLYYEVLIRDRNYLTAIPLAITSIKAVKGKKHQTFRRHHYLVQLYSLYGLTEQYEKEAETLLVLINAAHQIFDQDSDEIQKYVLDLAKSYCRQGSVTAFTRWVNKHNLQYRCD